MITLFVVVNGIVALGYGLLAIFFAARLRLPRKKLEGWRTIVALTFAAMFFVGCAHTHIDLALWAAQGNLIEHWYSPLNVLSHTLQAIGGLGFWIFATIWVRITIEDKRDYNRRVEEIESDVSLASHQKDIEKNTM